jgi:hypothetical protein
LGEFINLFSSVDWLMSDAHIPEWLGVGLRGGRVSESKDGIPVISYFCILSRLPGQKVG